MEFVHLIILFQIIYESNQTVRIFNESNFKQWFEFETAYLFQIKLIRNRFQIKLKHKSVRSCSIRLQPYHHHTRRGDGQSSFAALPSPY
jgi:hypothetical protein